MEWMQHWAGIQRRGVKHLFLFAWRWSKSRSRLPHNASHTCRRCLFLCGHCVLCNKDSLVILKQQCCHSGAFLPPSLRDGVGGNMDEHGDNDIKVTGLYLYDHGPLCAELHYVVLQFQLKKKNIFVRQQFIFYPLSIPQNILWHIKLWIPDLMFSGCPFIHAYIQLSVCVSHSGAYAISRAHFL